MKSVLLKSVLALICLLQFNTRSFATLHIITVADFNFNPATLTIQLGDTIQWKHVSGTHTSTSTTIPGGAIPWNAPLSTGNPNYTYVPAVPGSYSYVCTPHQGMGMTGSFTVTGSASVSNVSTTTFNIFPNPAGNEIHVQSGAQRIDASLTDITGRKTVLQPLSTSKEEKIFSTGNVADGVYFLNINTAEVNIVRKLMIQK